MTFRLLVVIVAIVLPAALSAQVRPPVRRPTPPPTRPPSTPQPGARGQRAGPVSDTTKADTSKIVEWAETDSVMDELLARQGYSVTRYQGGTVVFDARQREMTLIGKAAVQREPSTLASDTIIYNDSTKRVVAYGYPSILRDPSQQSADLIAVGKLEYDLERKRGLASNVRTAFDAGERWYIQGERTAPVLADSATGQEAAFYALDGVITSCDDSIPDYHFKAREIKVVSKTTLVARPAVLYIADIPVMWLPFMFQDLHSGRRSGMLRPFFGVSEVFRNSPTYRRHVEKVGYYWAISDYLDASAWLDWRSGASPTLGDPGSLRGTMNMQYNWLNRFLSGSISASHHALKDGSSNTVGSWSHRQRFSETNSLNADMNYATNTRVQRQQARNIFAATATIYSSLSYARQLGLANVNVGGSRRQYPGRSQVDMDFPNIGVSTRGPINIGRHVVWTPSFGYRNAQQLNIDGGGGIIRRLITRSDGSTDSVLINNRNSRSQSMDFQTPIQIFGFTWRNSFTLSDRVNNFPETRTIYGADTSIKETRVFGRTYVTTADWTTGIDLPRVLQGTWNLVPSVNIENVDPGAFWVRSEQTGTKVVHQSKRLRYGVSAAPTFFGLFPGLGIVSRLRHTIAPSLSYSYAPHAEVSDEYLRALNQRRIGYLGALAQNQVSMGLSTNIEAKLRSDTSESGEGGRKVKLLSLSFDQLTYDFERQKKTGQGFTSDRFGYSARSDLVPGLDLRVGYSLFQGNPMSDTAKFKPYRETLSASFSLNRRSNPFVLASRVFGKAIPQSNPTLENPQQDQQDRAAQQIAQQPMPGSPGTGQMMPPQSGQGWQASFTFSSTRQRPIVGATLVDPTAQCRELAFTPQQLAQCNFNFGGLGNEQPGAQTTYGGPIYRQPPQETLQFQTSFNVTPKWAAQWSSSYDFVLKEFASHSVQLQRDLHDWRAIFAFVQAPNGNFAFNVSIGLKAEPDLKFDYNKQTYRRDRL